MSLRQGMNPCPNPDCDGGYRFINTDGGDGGLRRERCTRPTYRVYCSECGISGPCVYGKNGAIDAWNRMALSAGLQVVLDLIGSYKLLRRDCTTRQGCEGVYGNKSCRANIQCEKRAAMYLLRTCIDDVAHGAGWIVADRLEPDADTVVDAEFKKIGI